MHTSTSSRHLTADARIDAAWSEAFAQLTGADDEEEDVIELSDADLVEVFVG